LNHRVYNYVGLSL